LQPVGGEAPAGEHLDEYSTVEKRTSNRSGAGQVFATAW
jgi:hypothetical protein